MIKKNTLGNRIENRLAEIGKTPQRIVDEVLRRYPESRLDVKTLSALISRKSQRSVYAAQIAEALGVTHTWLTDGFGPKEIAAHSPAEQQPAVYERKVTRLNAKTGRERKLIEITQLLESIDEYGLAIILDKSQEVATKYKLASEKTGL